MKTKIGEINGLWDFFKDYRKIGEASNEGTATQTQQAEIACKLCGDKIVGLSTDSMGYMGSFIDSDMEKHIQLHERINKLNLDLKTNK